MGRGASFNELFWPVLQQKQIHFIFTDKVCLLCLSSNTKSPQQQQNFTKMSRNNYVSRVTCIMSEQKQASFYYVSMVTCIMSEQKQASFYYVSMVTCIMSE
jgi:hypothetical protein